MAKIGLITSNWSGNLMIGVTRGLTYLAQSQDKLHIGKGQGCFYCFKNRADSLELDSLHINTWGESNPTYKFLSSETRTTLHRNWVPFILSINLPSRQIRLLLRSSRNSACVIILSSWHLCGVRSWMQITREAFFSLFDRDGIGRKKMLCTLIRGKSELENRFLPTNSGQKD